MAELFGVAVSAAQLGAACCSLIDVLRKIRGCATVLKKYYNQLQELQSLSISISENPLLQTPEIGTQTRALLSTINNNCINSLLRKKKLLRAWGFLYREQDLLDIFVTLERQKSTLSLTIHQIQSKALYQIQTDIQRMSSNKVMEETRARPQQEDFLEFLLRSATLENPSSLHKEIVPVNLSRHPNTAKGRMAVAYEYQTESRRSSTATIAVVPTESSISNGFVTKVNHGLKWVGCVADQGFDQNNGHEWDINKDISNPIEERNFVKSEYRDLLKIGSGNQHNGHSLEVSGDVAGRFTPNMDGDRWTHCNAKAGVAGEKIGKSFGTQTNGLKIKIKK
ncbi:hypothetical protein FVEN_g5511 [Fusarium venenatum]|uniref:Fungal N-terminal domain-containing protein n=1 Tax=Fusarium venenatum TaxID=56646 RepID=A0A2L2TEC2_9HYPO|nr:uncharacterized protein FVRRES_08396 [Fusarium venenatum]KAG8356730.1 hypothetical protein FVEN_g5511 [Fusarium venenatum]KAH6965179.1 hypothetical protein EDB82DRAFT_290595 [Fusarium venenatum]CEI68319.1 unnamed protein product [Fusarium venenatum]